LIKQIRRHWPKTEILLRADSHYCTPQVLELCDRLGLRYVFGLSRNSRLAENISPLEASTAERYARNPGQKQRRFKTFSYAARSWSKPRRVIARVEVRGLDDGRIASEREISLGGSRVAAGIRPPSLGKPIVEAWLEWPDDRLLRGHGVGRHDSAGHLACLKWAAGLGESPMVQAERGQDTVG